MKKFHIFIIFIIFAFNKGICQENINQIFNRTYLTLLNLPIGSSIYYSRNFKCTSYNTSSSICLVNENLYKIEEENQHELLLSISEYSDSFYYELNTYLDENKDNINIIITHFINRNELIFKYYQINNVNNNIKEKGDYTYFNETLNPINKGINCQVNYNNELKVVCFYINNIKNVIEMDIKKIDNTYNLSSKFKIAEINDNNFINDNILIMSSLFKNKNKYFSCFNSINNDSFDIYAMKDGNINFQSDESKRSDISKIENKFNSYNFICGNEDKIILFKNELFKDKIEICEYNSLIRKTNFPIQSKFDENKSPLLDRVLKGDTPIEKEKEIQQKPFNNENIMSCLIINNEEIENIFFFQPKNKIKNFKFEENINFSNKVNTQDNILNTVSINQPTTKHFDIPSTGINNMKNENDLLSTIISYNKNEEETEKITINSIIAHTNYHKTDEKIKELNLPKPNITKEEILENIKDIMQNTIIGETYEYQNNDFSILIYPTDSLLLTNKTHIDFFECESILKRCHNLSNQSIITFFQMEITNKNEHSLINQIEYQVFDEQKNPLNLSFCNNSNIKIFYGIKKDSNLDISIVDSFKDSGINIFNLSDEFFNDVCYSYTDNGNDLILEDRIKDIYQNFTLCEESCTFNDIDIYNMLISCQCVVKENITTVIKEIKEEAVEKITSLNFEIIKCYNLVFSLNGKMKNIGFWILSIFFIIYIIFFIKYIINGIKPVKDYIFNEMTKFGYLDSNKDKKPKKLKEKNTKIKNKKTNNPSKKRKKGKNGNVYKKKKGKIIKDNSSLINQINISNNFIINQNNSQNKIIKNLELNLISINLNDLSQKDNIPKESNITLYNYTMEEAFKYDRRNVLIIFFIYFLSKQAFFHAFFYHSPLVLFPLRFCLLIFIISTDLALNAFFYFNDNISRKYKNTKNLFLFILSNNYTVILLSTLVGFILLTLFTNLSNTTKDIRDVFKNEEKKIRKQKNYKVKIQRKIEIKNEIENILNKYKYKLLFLFFMEIILMIFFWYYTVVFCHVFPGTQISWLIDSLLSMLSRIIIDAIMCLLFSKLYRIGVESNYSCIYKAALFFYGFC